ncbi:MAG: hypothetical protein M1829_001290 [Trizodia sp. TS-e1964]|nr:MAG: hypothetical protein M1829_001290 [Trizodia sp. TS-e1964]
MADQTNNHWTPPTHFGLPRRPSGPPPPMRTFGDSQATPLQISGNQPQHQCSTFSFRSDPHGLSLPEKTYGQMRQHEGGRQPHNRAPQSLPRPKPPFPSGRHPPTRGPQKQSASKRENFAKGTKRWGDHSNAAHERPLLMSERAITPEQLSGMNEDASNPARFLPVDALSDSEEQEMDVDPETDEEAPITVMDRGLPQPDSGNGSQLQEPPRKKRAIEIMPKEISIPKWSNPDPYTALPPPAESQRKKRDVVKLIRKARAQTLKEPSLRNDSLSNNDFISINFGDQCLINGPVSQDLPKDAQPVHDHPDTQPAPGKRSRAEFESSVLPQMLGEVSEPWVSYNYQDATPWFNQDHYKTEDMGFWLHKEILDFYNYVKPQEFEEVVRSNLLDRLRKAIKVEYPRSSIHCFGSFAAGLYLPNADMDLVIFTGDLNSSAANTRLNRVGRLLYKLNMAVPGSVQIVKKAKVPLVKFIDHLTGIKVDISFESDTGIIATSTFQEWKSLYPAMPILVTLIKQFLMMRGLNEVFNGGLGGFSVTCLVVSLLQTLPQVQSGNLVPHDHLGETLMEFLDLYGNCFNTFTTGIQLNPPGYFVKRLNPNIAYRQTNMYRLCIVDPNNSRNDISGGSGKIDVIFKCFSNAYNTLQARMGSLNLNNLEERAGQSLLAPLLGGNYSVFDTHRNRLGQVHRETHTKNI